MNKPEINVTPLIGVLLVLLIIFMVVTPLNPSSFKTRVPAEPKNDLEDVQPNPKTLAISIGADGSLKLNTETGLGTVAETEPLIARLKGVFDARIANGDISDSFADDPSRPMTDRIERTVFIKAPKNLPYGSVARIVDAAKRAGAYPISLQIDRLD